MPNPPSPPMKLTSEKASLFFNQLLDILKASWISFVIIVIIIALTTLDQSDTIVIDLLDRKPVNLLLFMVLLLFLALIVSHYPSYLEINKRANHDQITWKLEPKFKGWGFVTYVDPQLNDHPQLITHVRIAWGLLLLGAVFYIFLVVHTRNIELFDYAERSVNVWVIAQVALYGVYCVAVYILISRVFGKATPASRSKLVTLSLASCATAAVFSLGYTFVHGWSRPSYWWIYTLLCLAPPFYIAVRLFRKNTWLSRDTTFLKFIALGGFLSIGVLFYAHLFPFQLNPFVILLAQFIIMYGLVVIPIKHYFYYRQPNLPGMSKRRRLFFIWIVPMYIPLLMGWALVTGIIGNDLHLLKTIQEDQAETVGFQTFVNDFDNRFSQKDTVYFIASYGGGLKANIWNQLILDRLVHYKGRNILSNTVALSGVSGGSIGHAVFAGLYTADSTRIDSRRDKIKELGEQNFLSIDLAYLLGRDLLLELLPRWPNLGAVNDRAKLAMKGYDDFVGSKVSLLGKTFRSFWGALYQKERAAGRFFPTLIGSSAGTHMQRGIACSVYMPPGLFNSTFYASTDLLSFEDSTSSLPFLYAASCTNRFPIFSPAAKVNEKGHFIDGGYFENSGMLSLLDFYGSFKKNSKLFRENRAPTVVFIQITNGKEEYLNSLLSGEYISKKVKESSELSSVLGTVTSISFLPSYFMKKNASDNLTMIRDSSQVHYLQIHLPYYVSQRDIKSLFKASKVQLDDATQQAVQNSNSRLMAMVDSNRYNFVQPPLARLLGKQAVNYMEAALNQSSTWKDLDRLFSHK